MELLVYLDESGNTGDAIFKRSVEDSFAGQASFALAGVVVPVDNNLEEVVQKLKIKHNIRTPELKASRAFEKPKFIHELVEILLDQDYPLFIELMDKKFFVASNIVLFYLMQDLAVQYPQFSGLERYLASLITEYLDETVLVGFCELCRFPSKENLFQFSKLFRDEVVSITNQGAPCKYLLEIVLIVSQTLLEVEQANQLDENIWERFLPPPDCNKRGQIVAMLPNVSAFGSMYARINRFTNVETELRLIHDEQAHFDEILKTWEETLRLNRLGAFLNEYQKENFNYIFTDKATLHFVESHTCIGVQIADVVAGFCTRYYNKVLTNQLDAIRCYRSTVGLLGRTYDNGRGINIVASDALIEKFYSL